MLRDRSSPRLPALSLFVATAFAWLALAPPVSAAVIDHEDASPAVAPADPIPTRILMSSRSPAAMGTMTAPPLIRWSLVPPPDWTQRATTGRSLVTSTPRAHALVPLFASYAVIQALDVHSTLRAINAGAQERNPLMARCVGQPATFVAFKAAMGAGTLWAAERLSRRNRFASYALMFAVNSAYAVAVVHNYRVAHRAGR